MTEPFLKLIISYYPTCDKEVNNYVGYRVIEILPKLYKPTVILFAISKLFILVTLNILYFGTNIIWTMLCLIFIHKKNFDPIEVL